MGNTNVTNTFFFISNEEYFKDKITYLNMSEDRTPSHKKKRKKTLKIQTKLKKIKLYMPLRR